MRLAYLLSAGCAVLVTFSAIQGTSSAATAVNHFRSVVHRNSNLAADAAGRAYEYAIARQRFRGASPRVSVGKPTLVFERDISELGITPVKPGARGILVVADVKDLTGGWKDYFIYDEQSHAILYQMERSNVPNLKNRASARFVH